MIVKNVLSLLYLLLLFFNKLFAVSVNIVHPTKTVVNDTYYAGIVGPGQVLLIAIDKKVDVGGRFGK